MVLYKNSVSSKSMRLWYGVQLVGDWTGGGGGGVLGGRSMQFLSHGIAMKEILSMSARWIEDDMHHTILNDVPTHTTHPLHQVHDLHPLCC
jgi:hypothetical protein